MIEVQGDFFGIASILPPHSAICVTTNGCVKGNGEAVMGAGIAKAFAERWPNVPALLAKSLTRYGLHTKVFGEGDVGNRFTSQMVDLVSLPTKLGMTQMTEDLQCLVPNGKIIQNGSWVQGWMLSSPLDLVLRSCNELVELANEIDWEKVLLTRPGCGNGGLNWTEVRAWLLPIFDDRFVIVHNGK